MFSLFKKKPIEILSPIAGKAVSLAQVNDPTFSQEMVGKGAAIQPSDGHLVSPCDGLVTVLFPTLHAIAIQADCGAEILIHVGIDTVQLNGDGFKARIQVNQRVKKGDPLLDIDLAHITSLGYDPIVPVVVCNPTDFKSVTMVEPGQIKPLDSLILLEVHK